MTKLKLIEIIKISYMIKLSRSGQIDEDVICGEQYGDSILESEDTSWAEKI